MRNGYITALNVAAGGTTSGWVGDTLACYTACLDLGAPAIAVKAEFNVRFPGSFYFRSFANSMTQRYGMCILAAAYKASDRDKCLPRKPTHDPVLLREMDHQGLFFNEDVPFSEDSHTGPPPYAWTLFGDRDGRLLSSLTCLRLTLLGKSKLSQIEFFYRDRAKVRSAVLNLNSIVIQDTSRKNSQTLKIDGPRGERINKVEFPRYRDGEANQYSFTK